MIEINMINKKIFSANQENIIYLLKENFNNEILDKLYFDPKKIDKNIVDTKLNNEDYISKILNTINYFCNKNVEQMIMNKIKGFEEKTSYKINDGKIYVIIGLDTTTIYTTKLDDEDVTVLLLESTNGIEYNLDILLAHEYTHFIRKQIFKRDIFENSIGERFVTEGIACNYSREIVPNKDDYEYCIVDETIVNWVKNNMDKVETYMIGKVSTNELMSDYFYMFADVAKTGIPARTGYVYGYLKVKEYLEKNRLKVKDIISLDWKEIL